MKIKVTTAKGFTLIELLVVIAIISILAAILFPVFASAREKARQTSCASNESQIGLALIQYTQDFDDCYPASGEYNTANSNTVTWQQLIQPYVKETGLFVCADDPKVSNSDFQTAAVDGYPAVDNWYAGNISGQQNKGVNNLPYYTWAVFSLAGYVSGTTLYPNSPGVPLSKFAAPSDTIEVVESLRYNSTFDITDSGEASSWACSLNDTTAPPWSCLFAGHAGLTNYLFCDGHVKAMLPDQTMGHWFYTDKTLSPTGTGEEYSTTGYNEAMLVLENAYTQ